MGRRIQHVLALSLCACVVYPAGAQSIVKDVVIDKHPPYGEPLEKVIDYFTSATFPSVIIGIGRRGGLHLYRSTTDTVEGPWSRSQIIATGNAYERARAIRFPADTYPGVIASIDNKIIWFENPLNRGADVAQPWPRHVINPDHGCHDIRLADIDQDGKIDVICSASISLRATQFVAFQNDRDHWQIVYDVAGAADGVAVVHIGTDPTPHLVSADQGGSIYWYENPRLKGGNARTSNWASHYVGPGNVGNSFAAGPFSSAKDDVITAANEHEGEGGATDERGVTWYQQPDDPHVPWIPHAVGTNYRDVHEINLGTWNGGVPYFIVAEQEQACNPARPEGRPPAHPGTGCRMTMFQWVDGSLRKKVLANTNTQNQDVVAWDGGLMMVDANHGVYGGSKAIHVRVIMPGRGARRRPAPPQVSAATSRASASP